MSEQQSESQEYAQVNLGRTPMVYISGSETGGTIEVRYHSPSRRRDQPVSVHPEIRMDQSRGFLTPEQRAGVYINYNYGTVVAIEGDGNVVGDGSSSYTAKNGNAPVGRS